MSIPTPFNPMGTLGAELPYVQPVMKSANAWRNEPSFGCRISGAPAAKNDNLPIWAMMIGPVELTPQAVPPKYTAWNGYGEAGSVSWALLEFEKPLRFEAIAFQVVRYASEFPINIYGVNGGDETLLFSGKNANQSIIEHTIGSRQYFKSLKIVVNSLSAGYGVCFANLKLTAFYRP